MITLELADNRLDELYPTFKRWWEGHAWPAVPIEALRTMCLLAKDNEKPVAACWVFTASAGGFAMMEWLVADPDASPLTTAKAVHALVEFAAEECKVRGYGVLFTTCRQESIGRVYERHGFIKTDENMTHWLKLLKT